MKKLFAMILVLLMLCACNAEQEIPSAENAKEIGTFNRILATKIDPESEYAKSGLEFVRKNAEEMFEKEVRPGVLLGYEIISVEFDTESTDYRANLELLYNEDTCWTEEILENRYMNVRVYTSTEKSGEILTLHQEDEWDCEMWWEIVDNSDGTIPQNGKYLQFTDENGTWIVVGQSHKGYSSNGDPRWLERAFSKYLPEAEAKKLSEKYPFAFEEENGKFGLKSPEGETIVEPIYDSVKEYDLFFAFEKEIETGKNKIHIYDYSGNRIGFEYDAIHDVPEWDWESHRYIGKISEGTMPGIEFIGDEPHLIEVPMNRSYLLDICGKPIVDVAFENYYVDYYPENNEWGIKSSVSGVSEGSNYYFELTDGEYVLINKSEPEKRECDCGFIHTSYAYDFYGGYFRHGLNIGEEVFLEPVHSGIYIPFDNSDRIVIYYGSYMQGWECGSCKIIDLEKNILCKKFNRVIYSELEDGYYVGIGIACGPNAETVVYDEKGEPMPQGFWFIDKDGNILSDIMIFGIDGNYNFVIPEMKTTDDVIEAFDGNGNQIQIAIKDYAFKP